MVVKLVDPFLNLYYNITEQGDTIKMKKQKINKLEEDLAEIEDPEFEAALKRIPVVTVLPKEWDVPEDDWYDEYYKDVENESIN